MNANAAPVQNNVSPDLNRQVMRRIMQVGIISILMGVILFAAAGTLRWLWGWVYMISYALTIASTYFVFRGPGGKEMIAERGQVKENVKVWDRWLALLVSLVGPWSALIVAGLDERFAWSPDYAVIVHLVALAINMAGYFLIFWSMSANRFFSGMVRIQEDRGHTVASGGPYRFVRHPGYVGMIAFNLMTPILLGSLWALIPAGITAALFVLRTALEDRTLRAELPGYEAFTQQTKYRLLPGVW